jgi:hypothetical protein
MSARVRLSNDPYIAGLKHRSELAQEWFGGIAKVLQSDLDEFKKQIATAPGSAFALEALDLKVTGGVPVAEGDSASKHPSELTLSTRFSQVKVVANDPPGWLALEVIKKSPLFDGVLHRGAVEVVLNPHGTGHAEVHFVECDWLCADGSDFPKTAEGAADKLWDTLFLPKVRHQLAAALKGTGR